MNDIKRLRLQNQIFRHVATYYQKMKGGNSAKKTLNDVIKPENEVPAAGQDFSGAGANPFDMTDATNFTEQVSDYCTFTRCELSPDGSYAKIFVSIWGSADEQTRIFNDIKRHVRGMRQSIAKHIRMRAIPHLEIMQDHTFEKAAQIEKLI